MTIVHVVFLNQYYAPAEAPTAQFLTDVAQDLVRAGHQVSVVCSRRSYPDPSRVYPATDTIDGVSVYRTWTTGFGRTSRLGRMVDYLGFMAGAMRVLALQREVDIVVPLTTPPLLATVGLIGARLRGARALHWVMDIYPDLAFELGQLRRRSPVGRLLRALADLTLRHADGAIALGEAMARRLRASGARNVTVVHNWADAEAIRPRSAEQHALRAERGWKNQFVVQYSGNLGLAYEFDTVLGAAELLRGEQGVLFAFVGEGPRRPYVEREVARRGLTNVELLPQVARDELGANLTAGDVHLVTMRDEVAGLLVPSKFYGILAAGRPTLYVGPERDDVDELLREGDCGVCVAVGDSASLAEAVLVYRRDEARRRDHGRRARLLFEARFTKERALVAHRRALESLLEREA